MMTVTCPNCQHQTVSPSLIEPNFALMNMMKKPSESTNDLTFPTMDILAVQEINDQVTTKCKQGGGSVEMVEHTYGEQCWTSTPSTGQQHSTGGGIVSKRHSAREPPRIQCNLTIPMSSNNNMIIDTGPTPARVHISLDSSSLGITVTSSGATSPSQPLHFHLPSPTTPTSPPVDQETLLIAPRLVLPPYANISAVNTFLQNSSATVNSEEDLKHLSRTVQRLRDSGWYYEGLDGIAAEKLLMNTPIGTFLIRDSADPRFLFSLSIQTDRGPMSARIHYVKGRFMLDAVDRLVATMPLFNDIGALVDHYVSQRNVGPVGGKVPMWIDSSGNKYSRIKLKRPLRQSVPSLQHSCRLSINSRTSGKHEQLPLPSALKNYLQDYPYRL